MQVEYEATFPNIDKNQVRERLKAAGAILLKPEFLQKRVVFHLPEGHEVRGGWLRVRDEGDKVTMSFKIVNGDKIKDQKEICLRVDNFEWADIFLESIGCRKKAYQENKRESWKLDEVEITIDEWPFLEPFVEIEGKSENEVKRAAQKLGFDYRQALFCSTDTLYSKKYGFPEKVINDQTPVLAFGTENPFISSLK